MLVLDNLAKTYPNGVRAIENVSLEVDLGEIVAIVGGSRRPPARTRCPYGQGARLAAGLPPRLRALCLLCVLQRYQNSNRNPIWKTRGSSTAITVLGDVMDRLKLVTGSALSRL